MLYDHKPVFMAALDPGGGHAWVIAGIKTRTIQDENSETESREQIYFIATGDGMVLQMGSMNQRFLTQ